MRSGKVFIAFLCALLFSGLLKAQEYPGKTWRYNTSPEKSGWDKNKLDKLKQYITDSTHITGFMIVDSGSVVFSYGDVEDNKWYIASCRKSILAIMYGEHVLSGEIDLNKTLGELGIDDRGGLLPVEKQATVKDIISARSGVFHQPSFPGDWLAYAPERGTVKPGDYWLYSNWDFNVAGYIFEKQTHKNIYDEMEKKLATPLQMEDWNRKLQHKEGDTAKSYYLAYSMWLSTRDMERIGLLMLYNGKWNDKQLIDKSWVKEMLVPRTGWPEMNKNIPEFRGTDYHFGYGYMWWLWQDYNDARFKGAYSALGAGGQSITVYPAIGTVVAFKSYGNKTTNKERYRVLRLAAECKQLNSH